jgi:hypothetical protein
MRQTHTDVCARGGGTSHLQAQEADGGGGVKDIIDKVRDRAGVLMWCAGVALRTLSEQQHPALTSPHTQTHPPHTPQQVLIADFFFVLLVLAWLGAGLAEKATVKSSVLVDAWMPLWPLVFQPAIGVLMAGALASGGLSWLQSQGKQQ